MELRAHGSTGNVRHVLFKRLAARDTFSAEGPGAPQRVGDLADLLGEAPIGSRVRWTSTLLFQRANDLSGPEVFTIEQEEWPSYQHENTIKLGPDRYGAQGVGGSARVSRADVETKLAEVTARVFPDKSESEVRSGIFVSEIEVFDQPAQEQIEPTAIDSEKGPRP
jgi:hypothetical protein